MLTTNGTDTQLKTASNSYKGAERARFFLISDTGDTAVSYSYVIRALTATALAWIHAFVVLSQLLPCA